MHYATLRRASARTTVVLAEQFLARFPRQRAFLEELVAQHKLNPADLRRPILELADVYDAASLEDAFATARTYNTYWVESRAGAVAARFGAVHASDCRRCGPETVLRFQSPLIKPGMQFSRTRLSEIFHRVAVGVAVCHATAPFNRYTPSPLRYVEVYRARRRPCCPDFLLRNNASRSRT